MADDFSVNTQNRLKEWSAIMKTDSLNYLSALMSSIAKKAKDNLRKNKNIDTGTLAESIKSKAVYTKGKTNKIWAGVGIDRNTRGQKKYKKALSDVRVPLYYAHFIERGFTHLPDGRKIEAKPFLQPAVNSVSGGNKAIQKQLAEIIFNASHSIDNKFEKIETNFEL